MQKANKASVAKRNQTFVEENRNPILGEMKLRNRSVTKKDMKLAAELEAEAESNILESCKRNLFVLVALLLAVLCVYIVVQQNSSSEVSSSSTPDSGSRSNG